MTEDPVQHRAGEREAGAPRAILELDGLRVDLGGRPVLRGLTASLAGRAIGLLGPNGAGKTTLIHTLLGFFKPSGGTARVLGHDVRTEPRAVRQLLGYMPETDAFIADLTGVRFVRLMAEVSGLPPREALERAHEAMFYVGLGEARYRKVGSYSTGMKQMAKLAQALVHGPRLLFLDEPTNGLDPPGRRRMLELVRDIRDSGEVAVVLSSHLLKDVETTCDEVLVLKDGQVAVTADLEAERRSDQRLLELEIRGGGGGFLEALEARGCELSTDGRRRLLLVMPPGLEVVELYRLAAARQVQIRRLSARRHSLEDLFLDAMDPASTEGDARDPEATDLPPARPGEDTSSPETGGSHGRL